MEIVKLKRSISENLLIKIFYEVSDNMSPAARKCVFLVCDQVRHKPACTCTPEPQKLARLMLRILDRDHYMISLGICAD